MRKIKALKRVRLNLNLSLTYQDAFGISDKPVVLSRGIHSNLFSWQDFARELTGEGFDAWLIEVVGGPYTDDTSANGCGNNCPNYTFADLKDFYWPASIAGIQKYSGKNKIDYVGFSLGCSAALEGLESHQTGINNSGYYFDYSTGQYRFTNLSPYPVDTFVGIGCPGNFTTKPTIINALYSLNQDFNIIQGMKNKGKTHITMSDIKEELYGKLWYLALINPKLYVDSRALLSLLLRGEKMSVEVYSEFLSWMDSPNQPNLGNSVSLNNTMIIEGNFAKTNSDLIVPNTDTQQACKNINSSDKYYVRFNEHAHILPIVGLPDSGNVKDIIRYYLKTGMVENRFSNNVISINSECD